MSGKKQRVGTRAQVWHETATQTSGGLKKHDLMMNKNGRIVSRAKHNTAKKEMRLLKFGYGTKKGKFGFIKTKASRSKSRRSKSLRSKKMRGGDDFASQVAAGSEKKMGGGGSMTPLNPADFSTGGRSRKSRKGESGGAHFL